MDLIRASISTPWIGDGSSSNTFSPLLPTQHQILSYTDDTGQPSSSLDPNPNMYSIVVTCTQAVLDGIEADNTYYVNWSTVIPDSI